MTIPTIQTGEDQAQTRNRLPLLIAEANRIATALPDGGAVVLPAFTVATVPAADPAGRLIFVSDGDTGSPCLAVTNGTDWLRVALGAAVAAS